MKDFTNKLFKEISKQKIKFSSHKCHKNIIKFCLIYKYHFQNKKCIINLLFFTQFKKYPGILICILYKQEYLLEMLLGI